MKLVALINDPTEYATSEPLKLDYRVIRVAHVHRQLHECLHMLRMQAADRFKMTEQKRISFHLSVDRMWVRIQPPPRPPRDPAPQMRIKRHEGNTLDTWRGRGRGRRHEFLAEWRGRGMARLRRE